MPRCVKQWKDLNALADVGATNWALSDEGLVAVSDDLRALFPIRFQNGSIVTQVRVKFKTTTGTDGIKVAILKRKDDDAVTTSFTIIGGEQTYMGGPGTEVKTYNCPNFTIEEGYSYLFRIRAIWDSDDIYLYSIGIETQKRLI